MEPVVLHPDIIRDILFCSFLLSLSHSLTLELFFFSFFLKKGGEEGAL
jgi:hypothetical protein